MTEQVLDILKIGLLCLLYLFFVRVLWSVWTEVRTASSVPSPHVPTRTTSPTRGAIDQPSPTPSSTPRKAPTVLTVIEPAEMFGTTHHIGVSIAIGRDVETGIKISNDNFVSGRHAKVSMIAGAAYLDDLNSRNGTFLNGARLNGQAPLHVGDRIQIGYTVLEAG